MAGRGTGTAGREVAATVDGLGRVPDSARGGPAGAQRGKEPGRREVGAARHPSAPTAQKNPLEGQERMGHGLRTRTACTDEDGSEQQRVKKDSPTLAPFPVFIPFLDSDPWASVHAVRVRSPWPISSSRSY